MRVWKKIIICMFLLTSTFCFAAKSGKDRGGFLTNLKELKEISDIMDIINENYVDTGEEHEWNRKTLMQGAIKGMVESLEDPHSTYFTKEELKSFSEDIKGKYVGVGMVVQKKVNEPLLVVSPIEDGPASKVGIRPRDKIVSIGGDSTYKLTTEEAVKKLKGTKGSQVKVKVQRDGSDKLLEFTLVRETIQLKYVKQKMLNDKIGYLRLTQFGDNIYPDMAKALEDLQGQGMKALVLDLRNNPGGALDQAIKVASMFIQEGTIVSVREKSGKEKVSKREGKYYGDFPLTILLNGGSASASEIVAGAVKDHKRGMLVGEKTFGKGSVQTLLTLPDQDGIKITIAKYYTPSGISIHGKGIEPDVPVEDKEYYLLFDGSITNVDEKESKENKKKLLEENKGEKEAKKVDTHKDIQLNVARGILEGMLLNKEKEVGKEKEKK